MPRFLVRAIRHRAVHNRIAQDVRVAASCHEQAYATVRDQLRAAGQDTTGLVFYVQRRGFWRTIRIFPEPKPKRRGPGRSGLAGVREPSRPKPRPPSLSIAMDEPHHPEV